MIPLDQWVFNTEAHPLPIWGLEADETPKVEKKQPDGGNVDESNKSKTQVTKFEPGFRVEKKK